MSADRGSRGGRGFESRRSPFSFWHVVTVPIIRCHPQRTVNHRRPPLPDDARCYGGGLSTLFMPFVDQIVVMLSLEALCDHLPFSVSRGYSASTPARSMPRLRSVAGRSSGM